MPAPPNTSFQSCSRFCSRPRLPFISSRTQLTRSGPPAGTEGQREGTSPTLSQLSRLLQRSLHPFPGARVSFLSLRFSPGQARPRRFGARAPLQAPGPAPRPRPATSPPRKGHSLGDLSPRPSPVPGAVPSASAAPARFPARLPPPPWAPARHAPSRTPLRATTEAPKPGTQPGPPLSQTLAGRERPP